MLNHNCCDTACKRIHFLVPFIVCPVVIWPVLGFSLPLAHCSVHVRCEYTYMYMYMYMYVYLMLKTPQNCWNAIDFIPSTSPQCCPLRALSMLSGPNFNIATYLQVPTPWKPVQNRVVLYVHVYTCIDTYSGHLGLHMWQCRQWRRGGGGCWDLYQSHPLRMALKCVHVVNVSVSACTCTCLCVGLKKCISLEMRCA